MKPKQVNLQSDTEVGRIRAGQMFQVQSSRYGSFKSPAYRSETLCGWLYFLKGTTPVVIEMVDTLFYLDPLG